MLANMIRLIGAKWLGFIFFLLTINKENAFPAGSAQHHPLHAGLVKKKAISMPGIAGRGAGGQLFF